MSKYVYLVMQSGRTPRYAYFDGDKAQQKADELNKLNTKRKIGRHQKYEINIVEIYDAGDQ